MNIVKRLALLAAGAAAFGSTMVVAQSDGPATNMRASRLRILDRSVSAIEQTFSELTKATAAPEGNAMSARFEAQQIEYAGAMLSEYNAALQQADLASKTGGRQGSIEALNNFELVAKSHEDRLRILDSRAQRVIENRGAPTASLPSSSPLLASADRFVGSLVGMIIAPAHAAIALNVYNICKGNGQSPACLQAIAKGVIDGKAAKSTFDTCWNSKTKPFLALKRAGCTAVFVARLA